MAYYALKKDVFDINKVTVVGNPAITSDGVASGFTASDYIRLGQGLLVGANTWEIEFDYDTTDVPDSTVGTIFQNVQTSPTYGGLVIQGRNYSITIYGGSGTSTAWDVFNNILIPIQKNAFNKIRLGYNGAKYYCFVNGVEKWSLQSDLKIAFPNANCVIGYHGWWASLQYGSINLTAFKIYVDNQLVFQPTKPAYLLERRKEGYDPSKFTVVGTPTITEAGVASGFSAGNRLNINVDLSNLNILKIKSTFKTPNADNRTNFSAVWQIKSTTSIGLEVVNQQMMIIDDSGSKLAGQFTYEDDTEYEVIWEYTISNGNWVLNYKKAIDTEFTTKTGVQVDYTIAKQSTLINIGTMNNYYYFTGGQINLPSISITTDGKEIFTGSKYVYYAMEK